MKAKQLYYTLLTCFCLLLIGLGAVGFEANKLLAAQASKLSKLRADTDVLQNQQTTLAKNKQDIAKYGELNTIAETIVPQDKDQAEAVREIVNLAGQSGISKLTSITFPSSTLGTTTNTKNNPSLTQLTPVKDISGVYQLEITVTQDASARVPYNQFITFLTKLEQNRRTAQVSGVTIQPDPLHPSQIAFTLVIDEYIKP